MNKREQKYIELLKILAISNNGAANASIAACMVYRGTIVSFGTNSYKTHPFQKRFSKNDLSIFLHAETLAIYNAIKKLSLDEIKKCTLYVVRVKKDGSLGLSKPCEGCTRAILTFGIKTVKYTTNSDNDYFEEL